jgi:hypothetical protein
VFYNLVSRATETTISCSVAVDNSMPDRDDPNGILVLNQPKGKIFAKKHIATNALLKINHN